MWSGRSARRGDLSGLGRQMPGVKEGDLLAVMTAGAYGAVMASTYNSRPLVPRCWSTATAGTSSARASRSTS